VKLSFLILFFLVLSGANESGDIKLTASRENTGAPEYQASPDKIKQPAPKEPKDSTPFQIEFLGTLLSIGDQIKAASEQYDANQKDWYSPSMLVQGLLVIVGLGYTFFAACQWRAIRSQANIMVASERAWVGVHFKQLYTLGGDFVDMEIFNSGKSPGHIKDVRLVGLEVADKDKPVSYKPKSVPPPGMGIVWTIFPGESTTQRWDVRLEPEEVTQVAAKTKRLPLFGFVWYDDVFGNGHVTNFCREFMEVDQPLKGRFMIPPDAEPGQNEAT